MYWDTNGYMGRRVLEFGLPCRSLVTRVSNDCGAFGVVMLRNAHMSYSVNLQHPLTDP